MVERHAAYFSYTDDSGNHIQETRMVTPRYGIRFLHEGARYTIDFPTQIDDKGFITVSLYFIPDDLYYGSIKTHVNLPAEVFVDFVKFLGDHIQDVADQIEEREING